MNTSSTSIQDLVQAARRGDEAALGELLELHRPYLKLISQRALGPRLQARLDASDLVQQTFLAASQAFGGFEGEAAEQFIAWLHSMHEHSVQRAVRTHLHTEKRDARREAIADESNARLLGLADACGSSPSQRLLRNERAVYMARCLESLPAAQLEAIRLKYLEGLTVEQAAEQLGCTKFALAGLLHRGIKNLRRQMQALETSE